jgi:hypothetical protein
MAIKSALLYYEQRSNQQMNKCLLLFSISLLLMGKQGLYYTLAVPSKIVITHPPGRYPTKSA